MTNDRFESFTLPDGRTLSLHISGDAASNLTLIWHGGSPHSGNSLAPVVTAAAKQRMRVVTVSRPGYGASTAHPARTVGSVAQDTKLAMNALEIERAIVCGYSGGGPHALASAALDPDRIAGIATFGCLCPFDGGDWWFAGMHSDRSLRASTQGREARMALEEGEFDPEMFTPADWEALSGPWGALGQDAGAAGAQGEIGLADDDVSFVQPWQVDLTAITQPLVLVHGLEDRVIPYAQCEALSLALPHAVVWKRSPSGHVELLNALPDALDLLIQQL